MVTLVCVPRNFQKAARLHKRSMKNRSQSVALLLQPLFHFGAVCCYAGCDLVGFGQRVRSLLQVIRHCTRSLPLKLMPWLLCLASCVLQREGEGKKSLWGFVLGCSGARGAAAAAAAAAASSMQQFE